MADRQQQLLGTGMASEESQYHNQFETMKLRKSLIASVVTSERYTEYSATKAHGKLVLECIQRFVR